MRRPATTAMRTLALLLALTAPAAAGDSLDELLVRIGDRVEQLWKTFGAVTCTEHVAQSRFDKKGKMIHRQETTSDYLIFLQLIGGELAVEESRVLQKELAPAKKKRPGQRALLVTNGFSVMLLVFHPHFQSSYVFTRVADDEASERGLYRIDFEHVPGEKSPSVLQLKDRSYPLEWRGSAWIDSKDLSIVRVTTALREPLTEIGLEELDSEVTYGEISFEDSHQTYRLPTLATIDARTSRQSWRNVHEFTGYKRFSVSTEVTIGEPH